MTSDLGAAYSVDKVKVWHYGNTRTYHQAKTEVSAVSGEYQETTAGKTHTLPARSVRATRRAD